jgi:CheY-like chemotaxis protein
MRDQCRVLIIEDDAQIASVLRDSLDDEGWDSRCAVNGLEGLVLLAQWTPHVIILDLMMPVMDGRSFRTAQRRLERHQADVPVIVLSGALDGLHLAEELGARAFIAKPFELDDVLDTVARVCQPRDA